MNNYFDEMSQEEARANVAEEIKYVRQRMSDDADVQYCSADKLCDFCEDVIENGRHSEFTRFWFAQSEWSTNTFGNGQDRGPNGPLKHLEKEAREASVEDDLTQKRMEIADCLFLVVDAAWRAGMTPGTLLQTAFEKLEINKARKWGPKTTDGAVEHIREGEPQAPITQAEIASIFGSTAYKLPPKSEGGVEAATQEALKLFMQNRRGDGEQSAT